jgi:hypothetical protein
LCNSAGIYSRAFAAQRSHHGTGDAPRVRRAAIAAPPLMAALVYKALFEGYIKRRDLPRRGIVCYRADLFPRDRLLKSISLYQP